MIHYSFNLYLVSGYLRLRVYVRDFPCVYASLTLVASPLQRILRSGMTNAVLPIAEGAISTDCKGTDFKKCLSTVLTCAIQLLIAKLTCQLLVGFTSACGQSAGFAHAFILPLTSYINPSLFKRTRPRVSIWI